MTVMCCERIHIEGSQETKGSFARRRRTLVVLIAFFLCSIWAIDFWRQQRNLSKAHDRAVRAFASAYVEFKQYRRPLLPTYLAGRVRSIAPEVWKRVPTVPQFDFLHVANYDQAEIAIAMMESVHPIRLLYVRDLNSSRSMPRIGPGQLQKLVETAAPQRLMISDVSLGDVPLAWLRQSRIESLDVFQAEHVGSAIEWLPDSIQHLSINVDKISDESILRLSQYRKLRSVYLVSNSAKPASVVTLKEAMPWCEIVFKSQSVRFP